MNVLKKAAAKVIRILVRALSFLFRFLFRRKDLFNVWESMGFHVTPAHFYQPIPTLKELDQTIFEKVHACPGINFNEQGQKDLLSVFASKYRGEYDQIPLKGSKSSRNYYINNGNFESVDGEILYCMIRHFKPKKVIEVGSGYSTLVSWAALEKNRSEEANDSTFTAIEPYPRTFLRQSISDSVNLVEKKVQDVDFELFAELKENDVLFIDSSHVLKIGSDVHYEYLELIPKLNKGVIVHIHDIFLPYEYPKQWIFKEHFFWNEQYLLQAFLSYNDHFEVLWSGSFMHAYHSEQLAGSFRSYHPDTRRPGSFWIQKVK